MPIPTVSTCRLPSRAGTPAAVSCCPDSAGCAATAVRSRISTFARRARWRSPSTRGPGRTRRATIRRISSSGSTSGPTPTATATPTTRCSADSPSARRRSGSTSPDALKSRDTPTFTVSGSCRGRSAGSIRSIWTTSASPGLTLRQNRRRNTRSPSTRSNRSTAPENRLQ